MAFMQMSEPQMAIFDDLPETVMGLHLAQSDAAESKPSSLIFVLGGQVALIPDDNAKKSIAKLLSDLRERKEESVADSDREAFEAWRRTLPYAPKLQGLGPAQPTLAVIVHTGHVPSAPPPPAHVYGHVPFTCTTVANEVFYRCEVWPTSRRIDRPKQQIAPGTYACPASELPFFPTGFAAVGRYALPNLMPACYRWELRPPTDTSLDCGASVPLYGQAGGGVEVRFRGRTTNSTPIASPTLLPPL